MRKWITTVAMVATAVHATMAETSNLQLRTLALDDVTKAEVFLSNEGGEFVALKFSIHTPSRVFETNVEDNTLLLYQEDVQAESGYALATKVKLPSRSSEILLLRTHVSGGAVYVAVNDFYEEATEADWLFINATNEQLAFQLGEGDEPYMISPGASTRHNIGERDQAGASVRIAAFKNDNWQLFYSTVWPLYPKQRCLILFYPQGESIGVKTFFETIRPPNS